MRAPQLLQLISWRTKRILRSTSSSLLILRPTSGARRKIARSSIHKTAICAAATVRAARAAHLSVPEATLLQSIKYKEQHNGSRLESTALLDGRREQPEIPTCEQ